VSECDDTIQRIDSMLFADSTTDSGACGGEEQVGVLEALRELVRRVYFSGSHTWLDYEHALDAFAAEHPGIVDLTVCGPQCPAIAGPLCAHMTYRRNMSVFAPTGQPCPVLAERSKDTGSCASAGQDDHQ